MTLIILLMKYISEYGFFDNKEDAEFYYSWYLFRIQAPEHCITRDAFTAEVLDLCGRK